MRSPLKHWHTYRTWLVEQKCSKAHSIAWLWLLAVQPPLLSTSPYWPVAVANLWPTCLQHTRHWPNSGPEQCLHRTPPPPGCTALSMACNTFLCSTCCTAAVHQPETDSEQPQTTARCRYPHAHHAGPHHLACLPHSCAQPCLQYISHSPPNTTPFRPPVAARACSPREC